MKKIILILEALLMTAFVMAEEKSMGKFATNIELNSGYENHNHPSNGWFALSL